MKALLFLSGCTLFVVTLSVAAAVGTALDRTVDDADIGDAVDSGYAAKVTAPRDSSPDERLTAGDADRRTREFLAQHLR